MRLAVVGTGLIGASAALAARRAGGFHSILGWDEDPATLELAGERGAIEVAPTLVGALHDADVALVAVPWPSCRPSSAASSPRHRPTAR